MEVIPAIDLMDGACVRLYQGDFQRATVFSTSPVDTALRWQEAGAPRLHVVDLDGSRLGSPANLESIQAIQAAVDAPIQVGGGIRSHGAACRLLESGVDRVIIGTAAVKDPGMLERLCRDWGPERVVVAVDARDRRVAVGGWLEETSIDALDLLARTAKLGPRRFLYTDITRDGAMTSPNFEAVREMAQSGQGVIIASGGVSSLEDIRRLAATGAEAVVVGSALYRNSIDLAEAIQVAGGG